MAVTEAPRAVEPSLPAGERSADRQLPFRFSSTRDLAKFTGTVALFAILADAAVGHGLLWENDPYWTYWITKTFLIATVFGLGTAWLGVGIARGALVTAVHTLVLTIYYWSLSPIGTPSSPEWLDLEHTWVTGVPVHFGVIFLGYLVAVWLWQRRGLHYESQSGAPASPAVDAGIALAAGAGIALVSGLLVSLAIGQFVGATWILVRALIAVPFVLVWRAGAGRGVASAVFGGIILAFILATYSHFLGPVGLPDLPLRIFGREPPGATSHWLTWREEWLIAFPIFLVLCVGGMLFAARRGTGLSDRSGAMPLIATAVVGIVVAGGLGGLAWHENRHDGDRADVASLGPARIEVGSFYAGTLAPATAQLSLAAANRNPRVTPLPPHDRVDIAAQTTHPDGTTYRITATQPLVEDPMGRHTTWWGVGLNEWHHGESGIGSHRLPAVYSEVAVFAIGDVSVNSRTVAAGVPIHVMTAKTGLPGKLELD
ncbi:MAG TPA: hypothetical protein VF711_11615, partial [Acidimicrobiales bacterium]